MNLLRTNTKFVKNVCNVIIRNYGKPFNVRNPLLVECHMNAVSVEESECNITSNIPQPRVLIIGAGIAGLSAANCLEVVGITDYLILEAQDRVGGRIHTSWMTNKSVDLGAEFILGSGMKNSVTQLLLEEAAFDCVSKGLEPQPPCEVPYVTTDGRVLDPTVGQLGCIAFREIEKSARQVYALNDSSFYGDLQTFFTIRIQQQLAGFPKYLQYDAAKVMFGMTNHLRYYLGADLTEVDTKLYGSRNFLSGVKERVPNGFKKILNPLLKDPVLSKILQQRIVCKIVSQPEGCCPRVIVCCSDGEEFTADYVICTIPVGVLTLDGNVSFEPPLPAEKVAALQSVKGGHCNKVFLEYANAFWAPGHGTIRLAWSQEELARRDDWVKGISLFQEVPGTNNILCCYVAGREAMIMEQCDLHDVAERVTHTLKKFLGDPSIPCPSKVMMSNWSSNPFAATATYYLGKDSDISDFKVLSSPYGPDPTKPTVLFAGDGYRFDFLGTVHGARTSGIEAAYELIKIHRELHTCSNECTLSC